MNRTLSAQSAAVHSPAATPTWLRSAGIVLAASALVAICAHIAIPFYFTPVPLSMATFAVLLLGLLLTPRMAAATLVAYLAEGALGLPVFAPGPISGPAHLLGPTGGYLIAYPMAATLVSFLWKRTGRSFAGALTSAAAGSLIILLCGAIWLAALTHASAQAVFTLAILPFLAGEALKIAAAAGAASGFERLRRFAR
jgi:biotin transport system substrate-specific component